MWYVIDGFPANSLPYSLLLDISADFKNNMGKNQYLILNYDYPEYINTIINKTILGGQIFFDNVNQQFDFR